ncbi:carboxylesterase/lipase family protein [Aurantivibrio plasticivorans]
MALSIQCTLKRRVTHCTLTALALGLIACSDNTPERTISDNTAASAEQNAGTQLNSTVRTTVVTINDGTIKGIVQENGSRAWLGIPYAQPPVGGLRWKTPQPVTPWEGTFDASKNIEPCPQFASVLSEGIADPDNDGVVGTEDCLYLSVYAPSDASPDKPLPVMYWIFGGGNNSGYAGDYNGGFLAEQEDVIVVAVNYRLGALGWFIHDAILDEGATGADASGNWATVDTIRGLEWVRDNIAAFGGDPNNVTIFGESAGASNVLTLMVSPMAKGLFHRAISESGGGSAMPMSRAINFTDESPAGVALSSKEIVNKMLIRDGKASTREEAKAVQASLSKTDIRELLYSEPAASFLKLYNPNGARNYASPKKTMDGTVLLHESPMESLAKGNHHQVPIIFGTNRDERRIYMYREPKWQAVLKTDPEEYIRVAKYSSDLWKLRAVDAIARASVPHQSGSVFTYRYDWDEQATYKGMDLSIAIGAAHATEMALVFGDWDIGFVNKDILYDPETIPARNKLSQSMMSYWANFAYTGNPGKGRDGQQVEWQPWQAGENKPKMIIFDSDADGGIRMSNEEMTADSIRVAFMAEEFSDEANRCAVYRSTYTALSSFDEEEFFALGCEL